MYLVKKIGDDVIGRFSNTLVMLKHLKWAGAEDELLEDDRPCVKITWENGGGLFLFLEAREEFLAWVEAGMPVQEDAHIEGLRTVA